MQRLSLSALYAPSSGNVLESHGVTNQIGEMFPDFRNEQHCVDPIKRDFIAGVPVLFHNLRRLFYMLT